MTAIDSSVRRLRVGADAGSAAAVAALVASLPVSFAPAAEPEADLVVIDGAAGWPDRAAAHVRAARPVVVLDPVADDPDAVDRLAREADEAGVPVALSEMFAGSPLLAAHGDDLLAPTDDLEGVFVDVLAADRTLADLFVAQLRVLARLGIGEVTLEVCSASARGLTWAGRSGPRPGEGGILLNGLAAVTQGRPPRLNVRGHAPGRTIEIELPDAATARPGTAVVTDASGSRVVPTIYESAHRATLRRVHALLESGGSDTSDLRAFAATVRAVRAALS